MDLNYTCLINPSHILLYHNRGRSSNVISWHIFNISLQVIRILTLVYPTILLLMAHTRVQRWALYGHKRLRISSRNKSNSTLDHPESQGFLRNQVTSHTISTSDGQSLFSWLVVPLGAYGKHETTLTQPWSVEEAQEIALQILRSDSKAVIALYLHGSGNNLATQWRCQAYRNLSSGSPDHLYVLAFDYRGFGRSSGFPTEEGLIIDTTSVLLWIEKRLGIPRARILIVGHSLGSAIAVAAVQRIVGANRFAEYAGLVLCSGVTDILALAPRFKLGGVVPIIKPLTWCKYTQTWLDEKLILDTWCTEQRLRDLVHVNDTFRLTIVHAQDDEMVPHSMSETLYRGAVDELRHRGSVTEKLTRLGTVGQLHEVKMGTTVVRKLILSTGGHNAYMSWHTISFEVTRILKMTGAIA